MNCWDSWLVATTLTLVSVAVLIDANVVVAVIVGVVFAAVEAGILKFSNTFGLDTNNLGIGTSGEPRETGVFCLGKPSGAVGGIRFGILKEPLGPVRILGGTLLFRMWRLLVRAQRSWFKVGLS